MSGRDLYVVFTMDCERIKAFSPPGGPETWELSERAIRGFSEVLLAHNLVATLFIVPETAHQHRDLFLELEREGFELGMHLHPQSFGDQLHNDYLGACSFEQQKELLSQAAEVWAEAFGKKPRSFRPGNFSANDATFRALYEAGFHQGSVSAPERVMPEYRAVWAGTDPYPHHVHLFFRLVSGDLDFYEVPVSEDWERRTWGENSALELRVEMARIEDHRYTIYKRIEDMLEKQIPLMAVVAMTHNMFEYSDRNSIYRKTLEGMAAYMGEAAGKFGLELCPATMEHVHQTADVIRQK